jgi:hypothetical protein
MLKILAKPPLSLDLLITIPADESWSYAACGHYIILEYLLSSTEHSILPFIKAIVGASLNWLSFCNA